MNTIDSPSSQTPMLPGGPQPLDDPGQSLDRWRSRVLGWGFSVAVHLLVFIAMLWPQPALPPPPVPPAPIQVRLMQTPLPPGPPGAARTEADSLPDAVQPVLPTATMPVVRVSAAPETSDQLSESDLAGAALAGDGGGGGGGGCDTIRRLQQALRRDPLVRAAVENAGRTGRATMLWNGDWVQSGRQDGKGLSAVREAIMWEIAFAPEACRNERMHGLVLLSLVDGTRFALGSGDWRWSDMLFARGTKASR